MGSIISTSNHNIFPQQQSFEWNYRIKNKCLVNGECLNPTTVYRVDVTNNSNGEHKFYFDLTDTTFKERYRNNTRDFKNQKYQNSTKLAKYIWQLKRNNVSFLFNGQKFIFWRRQCLTEKLWTINYIFQNMLNLKY